MYKYLRGIPCGKQIIINSKRIILNQIEKARSYLHREGGLITFCLEEGKFIEIEPPRRQKVKNRGKVDKNG